MLPTPNSSLSPPQRILPIIIIAMSDVNLTKFTQAFDAFSPALSPEVLDATLEKILQERYPAANNREVKKFLHSTIDLTTLAGADTEEKVTKLVASVNDFEGTEDIPSVAAICVYPNFVKTVREVAGQSIDQVAIGSCTNSSYRDIMTVASMLDGRHVAENVSLVLSPGSRQVLEMVANAGGLKKILAAGARLLECTCGPCIGMGQSPITNAWSLRTFNRNFKGRSGTLSANVCLGCLQCDKGRHRRSAKCRLRDSRRACALPRR